MVNIYSVGIWQSPADSTPNIVFKDLTIETPFNDGQSSKANTSKSKLERAVDGAPSQIPMLKFLTPQHPQVPPGGMTLATE